MQRDMKIGLVVGVALIGIVGALFFRREPEAKDKETPPPLQNAEELDRQIAGKAKAPYIKGLEDFAEPAAPVPPPQSSTSKLKSADAYDVPGFLTKEDEGRNRDVLTRKIGSAPDPIQGSKKEIAVDAVPAHNRAWEPIGPSVKKAGEMPRANPAGSSTGTGRTHVIQPGDTLSGLAARYLGSSARYHEIYDANRNVLKSPDDLPDGRTIVIPDGAKVRDPQHTAGTSGAATTGTVSSGSAHSGMKAKKAVRTVESEENDTPATPASQSDTPREKLRFVPVNRGPFSAGRVQPAPGDSKSETKAGKKAAASDEDQRN